MVYSLNHILKFSNSNNIVATLIKYNILILLLCSNRCFNRLSKYNQCINNNINITISNKTTNNCNKINFQINNRISIISKTIKILVIIVYLCRVFMTKVILLQMLE